MSEIYCTASNIDHKIELYEHVMLGFGRLCGFISIKVKFMAKMIDFYNQKDTFTSDL